MKFPWILLLLIFVCTQMTGQHNHDLIPCATPTYLSDWFLSYTANPHTFDRDTDSLLFAPLSIHMVGTNNGSGYFAMNSLLDAFCRLNTDYEPTNIQFFIEGPIHYLNNSAYNNHASVLDGAEMMFAHNIPNTINTYFVSVAAGSCGYNLPYAGIAMTIQCSGPNSHTWAHEIAHNLSVQHTFLGWEGGISWDGSIQPNFGLPAPTHVTYNYTFFKDTLILDTLIIDTALVELVDGSNCHLAADRICDTPPDYLAFRWQCNSDSFSVQTQLDPDSVPFKSDGRNIMSYSFDNCQSTFTDGQAAMMRANLLEQKPGHLYNQDPYREPITETVVPVFPVNAEPVSNTGFTLMWDPVEGATHYVVQISPLPGFNVITKEITTEEPSVELDPAGWVLRPYYWRVRPFNLGFTCTSMGPSAVFELVESVRTSGIPGLHSMAVQPNPAISGSGVSLQVSINTALEDVQINIMDMLGRVMYSTHYEMLSTGSYPLSLLPELNAGVYLIELRAREGNAVRQWVVQ